MGFPCPHRTTRERWGAQVERRSPRTDQRGYLLIEVVVGAMLLVVIGLGIFSGLDGASNASGRNRSRSTAAFLAQQDQERLRTMSASQLNAYAKTPSSQSVTVGGIAYSVTSKVSYANDTNADASCTSGAPVVSYVRITSTVTDPRGRNKPVVVDSLVSPHADEQAAATVQVLGGDLTTGVPNIPVSLVENPSLNDDTDANGCVQYAFLTGTDYHVTVFKSGYVDKDGNASTYTNYPISVVQGSSSVTQLPYAPAMAIRADFKNSQATTAVNGRGFTIVNAGLSGNQTKTYQTGTGTGDTTPYTTLSTPTGLFPFSDGYQVYAGACSAAAPPSGSQYVVTASPPASGSLATIALPMSTVPVVVQQNGSAKVGADVVATDACGATYPTVLTVANGVANLSLPFSTSANKITICVDNNAGSSSRYVTTTVVNNGSLTTQTLNIKTTGTKSPSGSC